MADLNKSNFCTKLADSDDIARMIYVEHLKDYGHDLPHIFLGSWAIEIGQRYRHDIKYRLSQQAALFLEGAVMSLDEYVQNLIEASFFENVAEHSGVTERLSQDLLPKARHRLQHWMQIYRADSA